MSDVNVGVLFKSYEPLEAIQAYARQTEESGFSGGFWIAEAYHWFRQYELESRGCFTTLAAAAMSTSEIPIGLGITSPYVRHPTVIASEAGAIDELSGGRFIMGLGAGLVGVKYLEIDLDEMRPVPVHREAMDIIRKVLSGEKYTCEGKNFASSMPAYDRAGDGLRTSIPIYVGATGPYMQRLTGREADGLLLAGLTTPAWVRAAREKITQAAEEADRKLPDDFPVGGVILAACSHDADRVKRITAKNTGTYIVNKLRNIKNDQILAGSGLPDSVWDPFRKAIEDGTEENVGHLVTDEMQRRFTVISGSPEECLEITQELIDAGLNLPLLEIVGESAEDCLNSIRLYGKEVLPRLRPADSGAH